MKISPVLVRCPFGHFVGIHLISNTIFSRMGLKIYPPEIEA
ncbi:hypothetical protein CEV34_1405 [Brucella pseudogrignonensis]|uniref:Uncharacterized protein n=1 Tax=Brucella pseudogrignonensis TaxID=419475 RepID=A0A256GM28_9HYPH|nr:hypothetical protein CEV34_1405 [Brucella pseudogrignonensis]